MIVKIFLIGLLIFAACDSNAQLMRRYYPKAHAPTAEEIEAAERAQKDAIEKDFIEKVKYFVPRDPWRICVDKSIPGSYETNRIYAKGITWAQFTGKIMVSNPQGVLIQGWYGSPARASLKHEPVLFFVNKFPYPLAPGTVILPEWKYVAQTGGTPYMQWQALDYGTVTTAPVVVRATNVLTVSTNIVTK